MSKEVLQMKYHPAKKEVEFRRFQDGSEVKISDESRLMQYMNKKGQFVLQDYGNKFFEDIARAFDGLPAVDMEVITTEMDYDDFEHMVEYYNKTAGDGCKINPTLLAELPDMGTVYKDVAEHGKKAVKILEERRRELETKVDSKDIEKSVNSFVDQMNKEVENIKEKTESLNNNCVSLCFTGVYSAGKSALINALLGYRILPENINSETAKMVRISSPGKDEAVKIIFKISEVPSELSWMEQKEIFEFTKGPHESDCKTNIQLEINRVGAEDANLRQHEQIYAILKKLNSMEEISPEIQIIFPVALDSEAVQFVIYDTPGTDSNYQAHQNILMEALAEQKQSILVFVAAPNKMEGTGNNALLDYIKQAEKKDSKTSIDISRSLFVINWADTVSAEDRENLQHNVIKHENEDGVLEIRLEDKKLLFVSAKAAYASCAKKNEIATGKDEFDFTNLLGGMSNEYYGYCYRQNRYATSELATERMIKQCDEALKKAEESEDEIKKLEICSGLYALKKEIVQYGKKYASAVRAFAIIDSVDKALNKLSGGANTLEEASRMEISQIEKNISNLKSTIEGAIDEEYNNMAFSSKEQIPKDTLEALGLDRDTIQERIIDKVSSCMDGHLKKRFGKVKAKSVDTDKMEAEINAIIEGYTQDYGRKREEVLKATAKDFTDKVKKEIDANGEISAEAKKFVANIPSPAMNLSRKVDDLEKIFDLHQHTKRILFFPETRIVDKEAFMKDVLDSLVEMTMEMRDAYQTNYFNSRRELLENIKRKFESNLEIYSVRMENFKKNEKAMEELKNKVLSTADALKKCQEELNQVIWKGDENVGCE